MRRLKCLESQTMANIHWTETSASFFGPLPRKRQEPYGGRLAQNRYLLGTFLTFFWHNMMHHNRQSIIVFKYDDTNIPHSFWINSKDVGVCNACICYLSHLSSKHNSSHHYYAQTSTISKERHHIWSALQWNRKHGKKNASTNINKTAWNIKRGNKQHFICLYLYKDAFHVWTYVCEMNHNKNI